MAKAQFLPLAQRRQGNPLLGTLGSVAGGAIGGAMGGPLGAAAGKTLGGQLGGQGTIDPMAGANQVLQSEAGNAALNEMIIDPLKGAVGAYFGEGGGVWGSIQRATGFAERNKKLTGGKKKAKSAAEMRQAAGYKADGGLIGHTPGDDGFMSAYKAKTVGPLAGVSFKQSDGKVSQEYKKQYHNPLAKPAGGSDK